MLHYTLVRPSGSFLIVAIGKEVPYIIPCPVLSEWSQFP